MFVLVIGKGDRLCETILIMTLGTVFDLWGDSAKKSMDGPMVLGVHIMKICVLFSLL